MSRIFVNPIKTKKILFTDDNKLSELYTLNNNIYFKDSENTEYKLNQLFDPINIIDGKIGINTNTPNSIFEISAQDTQLQLSYNDSKFVKFNLNSSKCLDISGQSSININDTQLTNVKSPLNDTDGVNKKYVDDKLACNTIDILNELCKIHSFQPSSNTTDTEINEQIQLRNNFKIPLMILSFAVSSEYHPICVKDGTLTFRVPQNIFVTEIRASLTKVAVGCSGIKFNIIQSESNCSLLFSDFYIPPGHKSVSLKYGQNNGIFKVNQLIEDEEIIINITQVGDIFSGTGLKISLIGL